MNKEGIKCDKAVNLCDKRKNMSISGMPLGGTILPGCVESHHCSWMEGVYWFSITLVQRLLFLAAVHVNQLLFNSLILLIA